MTQAHTAKVRSTRFSTMARLLFLVALLGTGFVTPVTAQDRVTVREELILTDRALERAQELLRENYCQRGEALLRRAHEMQRIARADFRGNTLDGIRSALAKTRKARQLGLDAVAACAVDFQAHEEASNLFESIRETAARARAELALRPDPEAAHLLDAGEQQLENAVEAYRAKEFRQAIRMATIANNLVQRALQRFRDAAPTLGGDDVEAQLGETESLIREVESSDLRPRARSLIEQARAHQERARNFFADSNYTKALRWTHVARTKARDASQNLSTDRSEQVRVERAIDAIGDMIRELNSQIRDQGGSGSVLLLEKADESLAEAREQLRDGQVVAAARSARLAGSLLRRAAEKAGVR